MDLSSFYDQYSWVGQLILYAVIVYYYLKNRNKKSDEEKVHWYRVIGMAFIFFTIVSICIMAIIFYDDPARFAQIRWPFILISFLVYAISNLFIAYRFRRQKNPLNTKPELNQENTL